MILFIETLLSVKPVKGNIVNSLIKFLPSYVGSKASWVKHLQHLKGKDFVELFCGSAVLSANLAKTAVLNDSDLYIHKILTNYPEIKSPAVFTEEDYFRVRKLPNWWEYIYPLLSLSFSGVFRYSKNGFNVPIKHKKTIYNLDNKVNLSKKRFKELSPIVLNMSYIDVPMEFLENKIVILDPPYENSKASYNNVFDYHTYWTYTFNLIDWADRVIVFDRKENIPFVNIVNQRNMRVNGKYKGGVEVMFDFKEELEKGKKGEELIKEYLVNATKTDGFNSDFILNDKTKMELKTDFYDSTKTPNFCIERYSDIKQKTDGGPWKAYKDGSVWFYYLFYKNKELYIMNTKKLIEYIEQHKESFEKRNIPNKSWVTGCYLVPRQQMTHLFTKVNI